MATAELSTVGSPDRELVRRFGTGRDESAFAELVRRHLPAVQAVCRAFLRHEQDAEDAAQATFLVLARRAKDVAWRDDIGPWLRSVARRVCRKAQTADACRRRHEAEAGREPPCPDPRTAELRELVEEELRRLPPPYQGPVRLCHLEGRSPGEAARELGCTEGQLRGRLWRGRELLRARLGRHALPALPPVADAADAASHLAAWFADGPLPPALGGEPARLAEGVLTAMKLQKYTTATLLALIALLAAGSPLLLPARADHAPAGPAAVEKGDDEKPGEKVAWFEGVIKSIAADGTSLTVDGEEDDDKRVEKPFSIARETRVTVAGRDYKPADLKPGMRVRVGSKTGEKAASAIEAGWPRLKAALKGVDAARSTLTVALEFNGVDVEVAFPLPRDGVVLLDELPAGLADLEAGKEVEIELSPDKKSALAVHADGAKDDLPATLKAAEAGRVMILLPVEGREVDLSLDLAKDARIRFAGKDVAAADLKPGMRVRLRLAADRRTVATVWAAEAKPEEADRD